MRLLLASNSPRRRELLARLVPDFGVEPSRFAECGAGFLAYDAALANARGKAREVASRCPGCAVLGADTVVSPDGREIFGKPRDAAQARAMLRTLSGREHFVYSGVCLIARGREDADTVCTRVYFSPLTDELIDRYVASGLPMDKAGAYGIQDGYPLVSRYEGSWSNVVGLPLERLQALLRAAGLI